MTNNFVAGIDVAGRKRGYQMAFLELESDTIASIHAIQSDPSEVIEKIEEQNGECLQIAIDSPPEARINDENENWNGKTRLAERQLNNDGFNVQWTPRGEGKPSPGEWMKNGEELWEALKTEFGDAKVIETFPTASVRGMSGQNVNLPLTLINSKERRNEAKDFVDASICAIIAREYVVNRDGLEVYGNKNHDDRYEDDDDDVLGKIYTLSET